MSGLSASAVVTAVEAVEQALHEIAVLVVEALAVAQQDRRIVRELVGEAIGEHLQDLLGAVAVMEVAQGARELGFGKKVRSVAKRRMKGTVSRWRSHSAKSLMRRLMMVSAWVMAACRLAMP